MKNLFKLALMLFAVLVFTACGNKPTEEEAEGTEEPIEAVEPEVQESETIIEENTEDSTMMEATEGEEMPEGTTEEEPAVE